MDFFDVVDKRRSVRKFTSREVPRAVMEKALQAGLLAPNSSNLQPWEFYWVKDSAKKAKLVEACLSQGAAKTAAELVVAVARTDTWPRNSRLLLKTFEQQGSTPPKVLTYYRSLIPWVYRQGPLGILGLLKRPVFFVAGLFRPVPRGPHSPAQLREVVSKTTALACQNIMLALVAQGFDSCPMEGFDEVRVKKILGLKSGSHVVMVLGIGEGDPEGVYGPRVRLDEKLFIKIVDG